MLQRLFRILIFVLTGLGLGYCSAQTAIVYGIGVTAVRNGPWTAWPAAGSPSADPYTRAHFANTGELPLASFEAIIFRAFDDQAGNPLVANCDYVVEGSPLDVRWWNFTVYSDEAMLIENPADRYSFNSDNVVLKADSSYQIFLSQKAQSGNWIPTGEEDDDFVITLRMFGPGQKVTADLANVPLPKITRGKCR